MHTFLVFRNFDYYLLTYVLLRVIIKKGVAQDAPNLTRNDQTTKEEWF